MRKSKRMYALRLPLQTRAMVVSLSLIACGPIANIPPRPIAISAALSEDDPATQMVRAIAPVLYLQRDEWFQLSRVVAVIHPKRQIVGYYLLWRDDVHGAWIPFTNATDEEIVWVGYDSTSAPTDVWTYWHGKILHADWRNRGTVTINVQWGKHGSMPRGIVDEDPLWPGTLSNFWVSAWVGLPDIWLGRLTRRGPLCFCHGYRRYTTFDRPVLTGDKIDVIARTDDPHPVLSAVFGLPYSEKAPWP
jgi:hypothetical protein